MKPTFIILALFVFFVIGCSSGGTPCPEMDTSIILELPNGDISFSIIKQGELDRGAVFSKEDCQVLLEKYKAQKIKELGE